MFGWLQVGRIRGAGRTRAGRAGLAAAALGSGLALMAPALPAHATDYGPDTCLMGYVWRDASPTDHVCVTGATRAQVLADNAVKASRWVNGAYGPHTCVNGYVWREAFGGDDVCVSGTQRSQARADNAAAASRRDSVTVSHDSYWGDGDPVSRQFFFVAHVNPGPVRFEVHRLDGSLAVAWSSTSYPYPPIGGAICGLSSGLPTAYGAPNAYLRVIDQVSGRHSDIAITVVLPTGAAQENTFTCMA